MGAVGALRTGFVGTRGEVLRLSLITACITSATLGLYRSWMKTRLRQWYWSSVNIGGQPFEYSGTASEKFLGFLVAISFLTFYLAVVNVLLMSGSIALLYTAYGAYILSVIGLLPVVLYARYQGWRYIVNRTAWRGVRFQMAPGGFRFMLLGLRYLGASILTLGFLFPRAAFELQKFENENISYGDAPFRQGGDASLLKPAWRYGQIAVAANLAVVLAALLINRDALYALWLTVPAWLAAWAYFRAERFRLMTSALRAGGMAFRSDLDAVAVTKRFMIGSIIVFAILALLYTYGRSAFEGRLDALSYTELLAFNRDAAEQRLFILSIFAYACFLYVLWSVLSHLLIKLPMARLFAESVSIEGAEGLDRVRQVEMQTTLAADGLLEVLDLGPGI
ncbi:DUF898 family protein [Aestuariibius sp. 2305UL40-4]|uniref:DUF898 family protein n=1 Tax=Aestuariibius violaceus TaxID=3234132 RepID=UPI00345EDAD6